MASLELPLRYYWMRATSPDVPGDERNLQEFYTRCRVPAEQAAIVIVDAWDYHYLHSHWLRTKEVSDTKIAPALAAARAVGITIIHAPGAQVARRYPQWARFGDDRDRGGAGTGTADGPGDAGGVAEPDWPPREFRRREGEYAVYRRHELPQAKLARERARSRGIFESLGPEPEDFVVATGDQMHRLCRDRRILHLFYCGFSTAGCVQYRDVGIHPFSKRGYHIVLLRDCTVAVEHHDTIEDETVKQMAIRVLEMSEWAPTMTTTSEDFIQACRRTSSQEQATTRDVATVA
jgi:hypothetical protein